MTSGRGRTRKWRLVFERRTPPFIEPLMGWTGGDDPLVQVELTFPSRKAAVAYAEREGLAYVVDTSDRAVNAAAPCPIEHDVEEQNVGDLLSAYVGWDWLQTRYGRSKLPGSSSLENALVNPAAVFSSPEEVLQHPLLERATKRDILNRWAWDEYLLAVASEEGMPEAHEPSRLEAVKSALVALEERERSPGFQVIMRPNRRNVRRAA